MLDVVFDFVFDGKRFVLVPSQKTRRKLGETRRKLRGTRRSLPKTRRKLGETRRSLRKTRRKLGGTRRKLGETCRSHQKNPEKTRRNSEETQRNSEKPPKNSERTRRKSFSKATRVPFLGLKLGGVRPLRVSESQMERAPAWKSIPKTRAKLGELTRKLAEAP